MKNHYDKEITATDRLQNMISDDNEGKEDAEASGEQATSTVDDGDEVGESVKALKRV